MREPTTSGSRPMLVLAVLLMAAAGLGSVIAVAAQPSPPVAVR